MPIDTCEGHARRRWWLLLGYLWRWHKWRWGASRRWLGHAIRCCLLRVNQQASGLEKLLQTPKCSVEAFDQLEERDWRCGFFLVEKCANDRTSIRGLGKVRLKVGLNQITCPPLCNRTSEQQKLRCLHGTSIQALLDEEEVIQDLVFWDSATWQVYTSIQEHSCKKHILLCVASDR